jgi:cytochrome bd-type quinol oxidase subunit 2
LQRFSLQLDTFEYWKNQAETVKQYWSIYGGFRALFKSPYFVASILLTTVTGFFWAANNKGEYLVKASDLAISAIPNLLGFTVGALAIVLAFSSAKIFKLLAEEGDPQSYFMKLTSNLVHFILVQVIALICGIVAKITDSRALDVLTLFFLFYAILVTFSTALQLFLTAQVYNAHTSLDREDKQD